MEYDFTKEQLAFREDVEDFVKEELPAGWDNRTQYWPAGFGTCAQMEYEFQDISDPFRLKVAEKGWLSVGWPEEYGGMNSWLKNAILEEVMSYYRAPYGGVATWISAPTILQVANEKMKKKWLPMISSGDATFWLGYSEPNAGSDLGALKTKAIDDGDAFVLNGQKTWSSAAHVTKYCWMLARTDQSAGKHKGATLMIVDNNTPGITIRPIVNIVGLHSFNEVFFDDVRVPKENVVGEVNKGFYYVMLALQYERLIIGMGTFKRVLEELVQHVKETERNGKFLSKDPLIRNKLAAIAVEIEVLYGFYWRAASMLEKGLVPEREASILKIFGTELSGRLAATALDILGPYGQLNKGSKWAVFNGRAASGYLDATSGPIGAGTSEVQRSIVATRGLGLPR